MEYIVKDAETPKVAWKAVYEAFGQTTRVEIVALRNKFVNTKFTPPETMEMFINRLLTVAKELELASKAVPDDEIAYQILSQLPTSYDHIVFELCQLSDENFCTQTVRQALVAEFDRIQRQAVLNENGTVKISSAQKSSSNLQLQSANETRNYEYFRPYSHQWKKCRISEENITRNAEAVFSTELISEHTLSHWITNTTSNDNYAMTEYFSLTFALYRIV